MIINYKELGQRIRDCRKKKGITQQRLLRVCEKNSVKTE